MRRVLLIPWLLILSLAMTCTTSAAPSAVLYFTTSESWSAGTDEVDRLRTLGYAVSATSDPDRLAFDNLVRFDLVIVAFVQAGRIGRFRDGIETYVRGGGGLFVHQPNAVGILDYAPAGFGVEIRRSDYPRAHEACLVNSSHAVASGLTDEDLAGDAEGVGFLGPSYAVLARRCTDGDAALAVGNFGRGKVAFDSGNLSYSAITPPSDRMVRNLLDWLASPSFDLLDDYTCYKIRETKRRSEMLRGIPLVSQLGADVVNVKAQKFLCPPTHRSTNSESILFPDILMNAYAIKPVKREDEPGVVVIDNTLGPQILRTGKPSRLMLPTTAATGGAAAPPTTPMDDYECFKVKQRKRRCTSDPTIKCKTDIECLPVGGVCYEGIPGRQTEKFQDQFDSQSLEIVKPRLLCLPVEIDRPVINFADHLMCYSLKRTDGKRHVPVEGLFLSNGRFGSGIVSTVKEKLACLRSRRPIAVR